MGCQPDQLLVEECEIVAVQVWLRHTHCRNEQTGRLDVVQSSSCTYNDLHFVLLLELIIQERRRRLLRHVLWMDDARLPQQVMN